MELVGINAAHKMKRVDPALKHVAGKNRTGESFKNQFKTVFMGEVQESYRGDKNWMKKKKRLGETRVLFGSEEDEDSFASLCKQYRSILKKMYQIKKKFN